mgnify:CR=1 FL=1|tara:strand:+ start:58 stop:225 length:168 start_codon:yes stop_codon:yes gene_type:complete
MKIKKQRIWSKTKGIRHRMIYKEDNQYYIKSNSSKIKIVHIDNDLWKAETKIIEV